MFIASIVHTGLFRALDHLEHEKFLIFTELNKPQISDSIRKWPQ